MKPIKVEKDFKLNFKSSIFNIYKIPQHNLLNMFIATLGIFTGYMKSGTYPTTSSQTIDGKTHKHFIIWTDL